MQIDIKPHYILFSAITLMISFCGKFWVSNGLPWYYTLKVPSYTPAGWFISIMWTAIYILSTVAICAVWNSFQRDQHFYMIIGLFALNAFFNALWTYLFFYRHAIRLAFFDAIALWITLLALIVAIGMRSLYIAGLLVPYLSWITCATWLNLMIWFMN